MTVSDDDRPAGRAACLLRVDQDVHEVRRRLNRHGLTDDPARMYSVNDLDRLIARLGEYRCLGFVGLDGLTFRQAHRLLTAAFRADVDVWTTDDVYLTPALHELNDVQCEIAATAEHLFRLPRFFPTGDDDGGDITPSDESLWGGIGVLDLWLLQYRSLWQGEYRKVLEVLTANHLRLKRVSGERRSVLPISVDPDGRALVVRGKRYPLDHDALVPMLEEIIRGKGAPVPNAYLRKQSPLLAAEGRLDRLFAKLGTPSPARYFESVPGKGFRLKDELFSQ